MRATLAMTAAVMSLCLTAGAVQADAPLVSHWRLDEASGTTTVDAVTGASGTLSGNVAFGPGKSGGGLVFNGGTASGPLAVDTSRSFTVSAWVDLPSNCAERRCKLAAVSGDGEHSSRFTLGFVKDRDNPGNWYFAMTEADTDTAPITVAAVSAELWEYGTWEHLVGVYDAEQGDYVLYVQGNRVGSGRVNTPWTATGLTIGAARKAGAATGFWPGAVDEVRFYDRALTDDEVLQVYLSERG
jgi:hypothetical protein